MLETVDVGTQDLNLYERSAGAEAVAQLRHRAAPLEGARILHVNATPYGGGVAEILRSEIPLLRDLGVLADWKLITGDQTFFTVTKAIHNGLQGAPRELTPAEQETYLTHSVRNAQLLEEEYDLVVVHDPQPLALLKLHGKGTARRLLTKYRGELEALARALLERETLDEEEILEVTGLPPAPGEHEGAGSGRRLSRVGERHGLSRKAPGGRGL